MSPTMCQDISERLARSRSHFAASTNSSLIRRTTNNQYYNEQES
jgi:hypothetical protein